MASSQFENIIYSLGNAADRAVGIIDESFSITACSNPERISLGTKNLTRDFFDAPEPSIVCDGFTYVQIPALGDMPRYGVFVEGADAIAEKTAKVAAVSLGGIIGVLDEKENKTNFIKNVVLENIFPGDIFVRSRELHIDQETEMGVFVIRSVSAVDLSVIDILYNIFPERSKNMMFSFDEKTVVLVKELAYGTVEDDLIDLAGTIVDTLGSEFYISASVGVGSIVSSVKDLSRSFKEAQISLEVGKVFETEKRVVAYSTLGLGRLIYQLPTTLCEMFLADVFDHGSLDAIDKETLLTIQKFFENSLNVSETARKLFVHRNTLVYRLDKVKKLTGLDLRSFEDANTFYVSVMVKKYLSTRPTHL